MAIVGKTFRVNYISKNRVSGLSDVKMVVFKPNGIKLGIYSLEEYSDVDAKGIYYCDFSDADIEGVYLFIVDSVSVPFRSERQEYFSSNGVWSEMERRQIRSALGINGDKEWAVGGQLQSMMSNINFLMDVEGGKWELRAPNLLIMYKSDNVTEIARWRCYDKDGNPSIENIFKCERI